MSLLESITVAIALGTDAFSIAIVCGIQQFKSRSIIRISLIIALFHIFMPMIGIYGGQSIQWVISNIFGLNGNIDNILRLVGSGLLSLIGFYMVIEKWLNRESEICNFNLEGWGVLALAFSVSIDSLSVGISLGMLASINLAVVLLIGTTAGLMMATGLYFGSKVGHFLGEEAQVVGGLALIFLAIHFAGFI